MKQKRYNQEFKQTIVELYRSGTSVSDLSREYGVSEVTIYKWIKALSPIESRNPKKGYDPIREKVTDQDIIDHIEQEKENHLVQVLCEVLEVPRSTYYQSFHKVKSSYEIENEAILARIKIIHAESKGRYGAPKIHHFLEKEGFTVSLKRVQRLMKAEGIRSTITKNTDRLHPLVK